MIACPRCATQNPPGFRFCGNCAAPLTGEAPVRSERRKVVTILFSDVVESTRMGEERDPETMRAIMARYYETVRRVLERHGGTVEKFIGDAVMAVFGHPVLHEDDALRAVRAAAEMRDALAALNAELERDFGLTIETRTGVNTGPVVAGELGSGEALVTGDAVNVAARLQTAAEPGQTLLGAETYGLVRDAVTAEEIAPLELKGKQQRVRAWQLRSVERDALGHARHLDSPLVGREREMRLLHEAFQQAVSDRTCVLFTLLGSAGVGKSRLVHEFLAQNEASARILRGRCLPYGDGITFWPVAEIVKEAAGISEADSPPVARDKLEALVVGDDHGPAVATHVAAAIGLADEVGDGDEIFWAVRRLLETLAAARPLIVVFDDAHWAEPTFLDLIEHLADWSRDAPVLVLCVARPELLEARPAWAGGKLNATTLLLQSLRVEHVAQLVANLLGEASLAASVLQRVADSAEGNPLFIEEFVAMLIDDGILRQEGGRWFSTSDLDLVAVPPTIRSLLAARLDRLASAERRVIEGASVVGKVFWRGAVAELAPEPIRPEVGPSLLGLVRKELVRPDRSDFAGDDAFRFRHLLIRDAAYEGLPKQERVHLHERFAGWLERTAGERAAEYEEVLGYHLEQAYRYRVELGPLDEQATGLAVRAARRLAAAGLRASDRSDIPAARKLLERAAGLYPRDDPERLPLLPELAAALAEAGRFGDALALLDEAVALAEAQGNERARWRAVVRHTEYRFFPDPEGAYEEGMQMVGQALAALESAGDDLGLAEVLQLAHGINFYAGHIAAAREAASLALVHARRAGDERIEMLALINLASLGVWDDTPIAAAIEDAQSALDEARRRARRLPEAQALGILGRLWAMRGEIERGRRAANDGRAILRDLGRRFHHAGSTHWLAMVEVMAGDDAAAVQVLREGADELAAVGEKAMLSSSLGDMAVHLARLGRLDEAIEASERAESMSASDDVTAQVSWRMSRAVALTKRGRLDEAVRLADEALAAGDRGDYSVQRAWTRIVLAETVAQARGTAAAQRLLEEALSYADRKGVVPWSASIRRQIAAIAGQGAEKDPASPGV